jgi:hypothetical protein
LRERKRGAIGLTTSTRSDFPFLKPSYEDAPQLVDLTNHFSHHCLDALIFEMVDRRNAPDLDALTRSPQTCI